MSGTRHILYLFGVVIAIACAAPRAVASAHAPEREGWPSPAREANPLRAQGGDLAPTPTPTITPTPTPSLGPAPSLDTEDPVDQAGDGVQDTAGEVAGSAPNVEREAEAGAGDVARQTRAQAAEDVEGATGEIAVDGGRAAEEVEDPAAAAPGGSDLQAAAWTQASNAEPSSVSDLDALAAAGNEVLGEAPAESADEDPSIGDPPAPWWLPVTGSQWLVVAGVVAALLIALGAGLVSARRRRRHGPAGWAR